MVVAALFFPFPTLRPPPPWLPSPSPPVHIQPAILTRPARRRCRRLGHHRPTRYHRRVDDHHQAAQTDSIAGEEEEDTGGQSAATGTLILADNGETLISPEMGKKTSCGDEEGSNRRNRVSDLIRSLESTGDDDVAIKILYCGMCHSDLHSIKNEWNNAMYPMIPGHEIAGVVTEVGKNVTKFKPGDRVGVGCMVNSCQSCGSCAEGFENTCQGPGGTIFTYNSVDRDGTVTYGGYSTAVTVHERFVVRFPDTLPLDRGAPLLCAGVTVYSPMKHHGLNRPGQHVGVLGLGGLGHVAVKFAKLAFGMKVTVISTSPAKRQEALERLGADAFVVSRDADEMKAAAGTMDGIINTVSANVPLAPFMGLLKPNGKMIMVGLPSKALEIPPFDLIMGNKTLAGSCIGGMRDTQEMLDVAAKHGVTADIELVAADYVNTAMERLAKADVRYRFVIDIGNTLKNSE